MRRSKAGAGQHKGLTRVTSAVNAKGPNPAACWPLGTCDVGTATPAGPMSSGRWLPQSSCLQPVPGMVHVVSTSDSLWTVTSGLRRLLRQGPGGISRVPSAWWGLCWAACHPRVGAGEDSSIRGGPFRGVGHRPIRTSHRLRFTGGKTEAQGWG